MLTIGQTISGVWYRVTSWRWWWAVALSAFGLLVAVASLGRLRLGSRRQTDAEIAEQLRADSVVREAARQQREAALSARKAATQSRARSEAIAAQSEQSAAAVDHADPDERERIRREAAERLRRGGRLGGLVVLIAAIGAATPVSAAEPVTSAMHRDTHDRLPGGWWMSDAEHAEDTQFLVELEAARKMLRELRAEADASERGLDSALAAESVCQAGLAASQRVLAAETRENARLSRWWRRPAVMFIAGFLATMTVTIAWAVR